jgi:opacity protein-like surface antigen
LNKTSLAALIGTGVMMAALAPQTALADRHASRNSSAGSTSVQADLERRLQMMEDEMRALRSELSRARSETQATADKVEAHQQQVDQQLAETSAQEHSQDNMIFFRGGFSSMEHPRNNELLMDNDTLGSTTDAKNGDGWYIGAGFEHSLSKDMFGLTDMASLDGEVMFEYKNYGSSHNALVDAAGTTLASLSGVGGTPGVGGGVTRIENQLTQLTITAAPKIKLNNLGDFRPWVIPFGLGIHVISPPSSGVTVLNPGLMLGAGGEYKIWKNLYAGLDFRYHFTGDDLAFKTRLPGGATLLNKTKIDGLTTGAYLGFGF